MVVLLLVCIAVVALTGMAAHRRAESASAPLGWVSQQWLAEHLAAHAQ